ARNRKPSGLLCRACPSAPPAWRAASPKPMTSSCSGKAAGASTCGTKATGKCEIMMDGFSRTEINTSGARIVTLHGGSGPPVLLMHGNPFTHLSWHKFAPRLAQEFTVVATDLRGYGDSDKPPGGDRHVNYSFRAMAQDQVEVMAALGFHRFMAAGHDRGAR